MTENKQITKSTKRVNTFTNTCQPKKEIYTLKKQLYMIFYYIPFPKIIFQFSKLSQKMEDMSIRLGMLEAQVNNIEGATIDMSAVVRCTERVHPGRTQNVVRDMWWEPC